MQKLTWKELLKSECLRYFGLLIFCMGASAGSIWCAAELNKSMPDSGWFWFCIFLPIIFVVICLGIIFDEKHALRKCSCKKVLKPSDAVKCPNCGKICPKCGRKVETS